MKLEQILSRADIERRRRSRAYSVFYDGFDKGKGVFSFTVSGRDNYKVSVQIEPKSWKLMAKEFKDLSNDEVIESFRENRNKLDILVHCECADFLYGGFAYIATKMGYAIKKETRPPIVRNKRLRGSVCKHLIAVLEFLK